MFERYLKKPSTSSVGFLVLEKLNSTSSRHQRIGNKLDKNSAKSIGGRRPQRDSSSKNHRYEMISGGGGIVSDAGKSPVLSSSKFDIKDADNESFAVSMLQTTFEVEGSTNDV